MRVDHAVTDSGSGRQIQHRVKLRLFKQLVDIGNVFQVHGDELKTIASQFVDSMLFQRDVVIIVQIVDSYDVMALG